MKINKKFFVPKNANLWIKRITRLFILSIVLTFCVFFLISKNASAKYHQKSYQFVSKHERIFALLLKKGHKYYCGYPIGPHGMHRISKKRFNFLKKHNYFKRWEKETKMRSLQF